MRLVRFARSGVEEDDNMTLEDFMDVLSTTSVMFQAFSVLFKPITAGIDSALDARAREGEASRSDYW